MPRSGDADSDDIASTLAAPDKPISGLEPTVAPRAMAETAAGDAATAAPVRPTPATLAAPHAASARRKPSLETVGPTVLADAHDLAELPVIDAGLYQLNAEIGRGGMGRVLAARDRKLRRDVVIKVLHRGASPARFQREALITARLQHPSIVRVYDAGWLDGEQPFYAMEIVRGESLDRVVGAAEDSKSRLALVPHVIAVAEAIAYAHSQGVIHRDLKPHNV